MRVVKVGLEDGSTFDVLADDLPWLAPPPQDGASRVGGSWPHSIKQVEVLWYHAFWNKRKITETRVVEIDFSKCVWARDLGQFTTKG